MLEEYPGGRDFKNRLLAFAAELPDKQGPLFCYALATDALRVGGSAAQVLAEAERLLKTAMAVPRVDSSWFRVEV